MNYKRKRVKVLIKVPIKSNKTKIKHKTPESMQLTALILRVCVCDEKTKMTAKLKIVDDVNIFYMTKFQLCIPK